MTLIHWLWNSTSSLKMGRYQKVAFITSSSMIQCRLHWLIPKLRLALNGMTRYVNFSWPSNTLEVREQESSSEGQASSEQGEAEKKNSNRSRILTCVGPSLNATKRCQSGYTTESGMIKPHLQSLHSLCQHPKADLHAIVDNEKVCTIRVALASDGTALKPGLEYDKLLKNK